MIPRRLAAYVEELLGEFPAVALLGPRQIGKTTLARAIAERDPDNVYLDLESPEDAAQLQDAGRYLGTLPGRLVVIDEVQQFPELFRVLRGQVDDRRRAGHRTGQFLLLGSASTELLRQSSESLAGRIAYVRLNGLDVLEVGALQDALWTRGGFPDAFSARSDAASLRWRVNLIRTYLERDIPQFGVRVPAETLRRFWTMLAHAQGGVLNASKLARSMDVSSPTISRYLDLLVDLMLVRRLPPYSVNVGKRLVKSPKVYIRDSGLAHALLGLRSLEDIQAHPVVGASWEGFVIENILSAAPDDVEPFFFRSHAGAEIDLLLLFPGNELWAIEIKRTATPKTSRGFEAACADLAPARRFFVHAGDRRFPLSEHAEAIPLTDIMTALIDRQ